MIANTDHWLEVKKHDIIQVVKGRKYPIGLTGEVKQIERKDSYNKMIKYVTLTTGEHIDASNIIIVAKADIQELNRLYLIKEAEEIEREKQEREAEKNKSNDDWVWE